MHKQHKYDMIGECMEDREQWITQVMGLVEEYGAECEHGGYKCGYITLQTIRVKLREVLERKPLMPQEVHQIVKGLPVYYSQQDLVRVVEEHHGIK